MRKVAVICLCVLFAGAGLCWLWVRSQSVSWSLDEHVRRGPGTVIDFAEVAPFTWDRLYIFGPYTPPQNIHSCLGFRWQGVRWTSIEDSDGVNLVVFVRSGEVVHWFEYPRGRVELGYLTDPRGYAREEAHFRVKPLNADGRLALAREES